MVENHFVVYYRLAASDNACTKIPFIRRTAPCPGKTECPDIVLITAACSTSIYR
jgi:hypothetical protein